MKLPSKILAILSFTILVSTSMSGNIFASEKRDGLLISVGGGAAHTQIIFESNEGEKDSYRSNGFAFSARLGWCFNEHFLLYWDMRESAYFFYKPTNNDTYRAGLWSAIGSSYYLRKSSNSFYLTGAIGLGDLETGKFNSDAIVGTGISYLLGPGYIINNTIGIEIDFMSTAINKNDRIKDNFSANSFRLIVYWQFL